MDQEFEIRRAQSADAPGILDCLAQAFAPYRNQYTPEGYADTVLDQFTIGERMNQMSLLVAVRAGVIVGTVGGSVGKDEEGHLRGMAVLAALRGSGVAPLWWLPLNQNCETWGVNASRSIPPCHLRLR